jgi:hypothetical protein
VLPFLLTEKFFQPGCLQLRSPVMITVSCKDNMASRSVGEMVAVGGRYAATQRRSVVVLARSLWLRGRLGGRGSRVSASCRRSLATRSITPPNWVMSERYVLCQGILNLHLIIV